VDRVVDPDARGLQGDGLSVVDANRRDLLRQHDVVDVQLQALRQRDVLPQAQGRGLHRHSVDPQAATQATELQGSSTKGNDAVNLGDPGVIHHEITAPGPADDASGVQIRGVPRHSESYPGAAHGS
jgi:hypothetical protein